MWCKLIKKNKRQFKYTFILLSLGKGYTDMWTLDDFLQVFSINFLETEGKLKFFEPKISHHFLDLYDLILKMYTFWGFEIIFHKIIGKKLEKNFVNNSLVNKE